MPLAGRRQTCFGRHDGRDHATDVRIVLGSPRTCGRSRVVKAGLNSAVPPLTGKKAANPYTARGLWDTGLKPTPPWRRVEAASVGRLLP
jgi:hypothetical protein